MRRDPLEAEIQKAFVQHLRLDPAFHGITYFAIPNERRSSAPNMAHMKAMGLLPGVADMAFVLPDRRVAFIEFKRLKGSLTKAQRDFQDDCANKMIPYAVCRSSEEAANTLKGWINAAYKSNSGVAA